MPSATLAQLARGEHLRRTMRVYRFLVDGVVVVAPWLTKCLVGLTARLVTYGLRPA